MRKTREILRQKWVLKRTHRGVATSLGVSAGAVGSAIARATALKLDWPAIETLTDEQLEIKLYGASATSEARPLPNFGYIHAERKKVGVTLELLHLEYLEQHPDGYRYTQFCEHSRSSVTRAGLCHVWRDGNMVGFRRGAPITVASARSAARACR